HRTGASAVLAGLAIAALGGCGGVSVSDQDGSSGSRSDASPGRDSGGGSPDSGGQPDAQQPGQCEGGVTQLLLNPSFEVASQPNGAESWIEDPVPETYPDDDNPPQIPVDTPEGRRTALLGSPKTAEKRLTQPVTVPDGTESLELSFVKCFVTERVMQEEFDRLHVLLLDQGGDVVEELATYTNLDAGTSCGLTWSSERLQAQSPHAGESLQLQFFAEFDDFRQTSFYVDGLALDASGPCPEDGGP
ncbi:MAG TPA: hypothetical protein VKB80_24425, partial [Kofleriaceae bacterium]|nr:hypothetical protein [Kofleriaceae bacterium]